MRKFAPVLDVLSVLLFVGIGRSAHQHGITLSGMVSTTWPFGVGLLAGWGIVWRSRRSPVALVSGVIIVAATVVLGMVLRVISGQGIAFAFVVVAFVFLSLFLVGWRGVVALFARGRGRGAHSHR